MPRLLPKMPKRPDDVPPTRAPVHREPRTTTPKVPVLLDLAAAWTWRILIVLGGLYVLAYVVGRLHVIFIPIAVAVLLTALLRPLAGALRRLGLGRLGAAWAVILLVLGIVGGFFALTGTQLAGQFDDLGAQVDQGVEKISSYLTEGPLHLDQAQIDEGYQKLRERLTENQGQILSGALSGATILGEVATGILLTLFTSFFLLYDGERIWDWVASRFPASSRNRVDGAGAAAWKTVSGYIRGTTLVAFVDALGVGIALFATGVPLVLPLILLTFLGGFIPLVGAVTAGAAAVLVALVTKGPVVALIVLGAVIAVQQLEGHVLSPLVLGRAVHLHPLVIALGIAAGAIVAGIPGAIVAVPLVAVVNRVAGYLADPDGYEVETNRLADDPEPENVRGARKLTPEELDEATETPATGTDAGEAAEPSP